MTSESVRTKYKEIMIGDRLRIRHQFNPELSVVNIGHYKKLQPEFIEYIEEQCLENYNSFREFLTNRNLLLE